MDPLPPGFVFCVVLLGLFVLGLRLWNDPDD